MSSFKRACVGFAFLPTVLSLTWLFGEAVSRLVHQQCVVDWLNAQLSPNGSAVAGLVALSTATGFVASVMTGDTFSGGIDRIMR